MDDDVISIASSSDHGERVTREELFGPIVRRVVDALGGYNNDTPAVYVPGDAALQCLRDLKTLWRKDDNDDERTVARLFYRTKVLPNDLIPLLRVTAPDDKRAIAAADLICAMTWPIDIAEELKELDDEFDRTAEFTELIQAHLVYKEALLQPEVLNSFFAIVLPPLSLAIRDRTNRAQQIVNVILHTLRNLAFVRDLPVSVGSSATQAQYAQLQDTLVQRMHECGAFDLLLTIAATEGRDKWFDEWNTLVLEIFYLIYRGLKPASIAIDPEKAPKETLKRLLQNENSKRISFTRNAASRHSRFGTTIAVTVNPNKKPSNPDAPVRERNQALVLHEQAGLKAQTGALLDKKKRSRVKNIGGQENEIEGGNFTLAGRTVLRDVGKGFLASFNVFLASVLKDIRSERAKITEQDGLRTLFVTQWFLEFFLEGRTRYFADKAKDTPRDDPTWEFGTIAEVLERSWITWVLKRIRTALDDKPKQWTELQAAMGCLTQLLLVLSAMSVPEDDFESPFEDAAVAMSSQIIYNGEVLDLAIESLRLYKPGTQSLVFLEGGVNLAWAVFRMLEKWGKQQLDGETYVRKRKRAKRKSRANDEENGILDVEDEEPDRQRIVTETMFKFEEYEMKFANYDISRTLLAYLSRYKDFSSPECMKKVVNLLHRQAVKAKAEGLFFNPSSLIVFNAILNDQTSLPQDKAYKELISLITYITRQFFKAMEDSSFLAIEAFFPKNRNNWKPFSSWKPEEKPTREKAGATAEVTIPKGYSWSEQMGIAVASLVEADEKPLVEWVLKVLMIVSASRQRVIDEVDNKEDEEEDVVDEDDVRAKTEPSAEALKQLRPFIVPYTTDEEEIAANKNPRLKLVFRLLDFEVMDEAIDEIEWCVPASKPPTELQRCHNIINKFLEEPIDLEGKKASELLKKKRKGRRKRTPVQSDAEDSAASSGGEDEPRRKKRKEKKKKENTVYKSKQFIEDSDEEAGDLGEFLKEEAALRERLNVAAASGKLASMQPTGTKKRRGERKVSSKATKRRKASPEDDDEEEPEAVASQSNSEEEDVSDAPVVKKPTRQRPKPKKVSMDALDRQYAIMVGDAPRDLSEDSGIVVTPPKTQRRDVELSSDEDQGPVTRRAPVRAAIVSDDDDE